MDESTRDKILSEMTYKGEMPKVLKVRTYVGTRKRLICSMKREKTTYLNSPHLEALICKGHTIVANRYPGNLDQTRHILLNILLEKIKRSLKKMSTEELHEEIRK